jgi:alkylation response protein AidB-like acyl-CoA dehydrogenase
VALDSSSAGIARSDDLDLLGLRGSNTAALQLDAVALPAHAVLAEEGLSFLKRARPMFLSLQCGMSIGLIRAALRAAEQVGAARDVLQPRITRACEVLETQWQLLRSGLDSGQFVNDAAALFHIRLTLAALVQEAIQLELQGSGGRAYLRSHLPNFGRRLQESAFVPVVTPSLTQLQGELLRQAHAPAVTV